MRVKRDDERNKPSQKKSRWLMVRNLLDHWILWEGLCSPYARKQHGKQSNCHTGERQYAHFLIVCQYVSGRWARHSAVAFSPKTHTHTLVRGHDSVQPRKLLQNNRNGVRQQMQQPGRGIRNSLSAPSIRILIRLQSKSAAAVSPP